MAKYNFRQFVAVENKKRYETKIGGKKNGTIEHYCYEG